MDQAPVPSKAASIKWREPKDEFAGLGRVVRRLLRELPGTPEAAVYVAVPNALWQKHVGAGLAARKLGWAAVGPQGPAQPADEHDVLVGPLGLAGTAPGTQGVQALVVAGAVEGLWPAEAAPTLQAALALPLQALVVSRFQRMDATQAERLGLPCRRRSADHGRAMVACAPAAFLTGIEDALPPTESAEQWAQEAN